MAYRKKLFDVSYHYDDDTGIYELGELDYGLTVDAIKTYCTSYGKDRLLDFIKNSLIPEIERTYPTFSTEGITPNKPGGYQLEPI